MFHLHYTDQHSNLKIVTSFKPEETTAPEPCCSHDASVLMIITRRRNALNQVRNTAVATLST